MNDLISRKAAISAFNCTNELIVGGTANAQNVVNYINKVIDKIKDLPSAQPEIIRCRDCKHGSPNGRYGCRFYHYKNYETHEMKPDDFCSRAERREE